MEVKKSAKANLENKKLLYREIGLIIALGIVLTAFEWSSTEKTESIIEEDVAVVIEVENIPITTETPPPPAEAPKIPQLSDVIDIVEDDIVVDTDLFISIEDDASLGVEIMDYVAEVEEEVIEEAALPYEAVEEYATFMGGDKNDFVKWCGKNLEYPEIARENGISGRVFVQFTIDKNGNVTNVRVIRGVDAALDKAAVDVIKKSPKWAPAKMRDRAVSVSLTVPIVFQLR